MPRYSRNLIIGTLAALTAGCATMYSGPVKIETLFDKSPAKLTERISDEQANQLSEVYKSAKEAHSQQYGEMSLTRIASKSVVLAQQLAKLPDLRDGINPAEADALGSLYERIKGMEFPNDFTLMPENKRKAEKTPGMTTHHVRLRWRSQEQLPYHGTVKIEDMYVLGNLEMNSIVPIDFEASDKVTLLNKTERTAEIGIEGLLGKGDSDGLDLIFSSSNMTRLTIRLDANYDVEIPSDATNLELDKTLDFQTILDQAIEQGLKHGDFRYSPSLEALMWHLMDNKDPGSIASSSIKDFTMKVWDGMDGQRWSDPNQVILRLNDPELVALYMSGHFGYRTTYKPQDFSTTIKTGIGDCKAYAIVACEAMSRASYDHFLFTMDPQSPRGHTICVFRQDSGELWTLDNTRHGLSGPYESESQIKRAFNYPNAMSLKETLYQIFFRFR
ncbi:MAG: hypothetical protein NTW68_07075 [candidate division NC10 bacterium]|nr:hypothetical protein [candidate division NC10 bacterium]